MYKKVTKVELKEALDVLKMFHNLSKKRMREGTKRHGTEMIKDPIEELEEELADAINYIILGYIKVLQSLGNYKEIWLVKEDVQNRIIGDENGLVGETKLEEKKSSNLRRNPRNRKGNSRTSKPKRL